MLSGRLRTVLACALATISVGSAGLALAGGTPPESPSFDDSPTPMTTSISDEQRAFPVLSRERTAADEMPKRVVSQIGNPSVGGKNIALTRAISTASGTGWIVPGNGSICLAAPDPASPPNDPTFGMTCSTTAWAAEHGLTVLLIDPRKEAGVATVATPAESEVRRTRLDGNSTTVPAHDGIASTPVVAGESLVVTTARGTTAVTIPSGNER